MIDSKLQLGNILKKEFSNYFPTKYRYAKAIATSHNDYWIWKYQKNLRYLEYYKSKWQNALHSARIEHYFIKHLYKASFCLCSRKVNVLGRKLGIDAWSEIFDEGLTIYHSAGGIIVNSKCKIGKNCKLHGMNCIGNKGNSEGAPTIGDNCDIGIGAKIIGNIELGNNITIAAGAIVINDCPEDNVVLAGIPATIKKRK